MKDNRMNYSDAIKTFHGTSDKIAEELGDPGGVNP
jgi:hypothetical protein